MNDEKQAVLSAIQKINAVEGFDPTPLAVEYVDLNTQEKRLRLPVMAQLAWFRLKYPEGRVSVAVTAAKDCFVATARVYPSYTNLPDQYLAEATASRGYLADKPTVCSTISLYSTSNCGQPYAFKRRGAVFCGKNDGGKRGKR